MNRSSSVRVLHLKMNPETEHHAKARDSEVGALRAENASLKEAIEKLEAQVHAQGAWCTGGGLGLGACLCVSVSLAQEVSLLAGQVSLPSCCRAAAAAAAAPVFTPAHLNLR